MTKHFLFSFARSEQFRAISKKKLDLFSGAELPGDLPANAAALPEHFRVLGIRDLVSPQLARLIPSENRTMRNEFLNVFSENCRRAAKRKARYATADFDLPRAVADEKYAEKLRLLLRGLFGMLEENKLTLLLPVRFPGASSGSALKSREFCRGLLYPGIGLYLDFYPHEPGAFAFAESLHALRFDAGYWRVHFEPERGNQLTVPLLDRLFTAVGETHVPEVCFAIAPGNTVPDEPAFSALNETLSHYRNGEK